MVGISKTVESFDDGPMDPLIKYSPKKKPIHISLGQALRIAVQAKYNGMIPQGITSLWS
jgi:hypothetical protein